jgi:cell division protein FtsL
MTNTQAIKIKRQKVLPAKKTIARRPTQSPFEDVHFFVSLSNNVSKSRVKKLILRTLFITIFVSVGVNLIVNTKIAELAFSVQKYESQSMLYSQKIDSINNKINKKMAPDNLLNFAKSYGMIKATGVKYIDVKKKKIYHSTTKNIKKY